MSEPSDATTMPPGAVGAAAPPVADGYEILGELGRGGAGVVYRARQRSLNRVVALKMLLSGAHAGESELLRFRAEAEAVARLQHPNIVQVFEVGEHAGAAYLALEFCDGGSLADALRERPMPPADAAALAETLARAVEAAHRAGVVHRDLKPANVMLSYKSHETYRTYESPKITDFGLAKRDGGSGQTRTGAIMGTPSYMAPEQAAGAKHVGPPADIWALGAILYECLTGRPPFQAATTYDTLSQVIAAEPVPPRQLNAQVPRDLETITLKCLQKDPSRRYPSAEALADDLRRFQAGEPIRARPVGPIERAARWCGRNRAVAASLLAVALALLSATTISLFSAAAARESEYAAERDRDRAIEQKKRADDEAIRATESAALATRALLGSRMNLARQSWYEDRPVYAAELLRGLDKSVYRGFEWHWLDRMARSAAMEVHGLGVAGDSDVLERLERLLEAMEFHGLGGDGDGGERLAVSPDGRWIVVGGRELWILNAANGTPVARHPGPVVGLCLSRDGSLLATAGPLGSGVTVREMPSGRRLGKVPGGRAAAFSPDGVRVAVLARTNPSRPPAVTLYDWRTNRFLWSFSEPSLIPRSLAVSPDGDTLAVGGEVIVNSGGVFQAVQGKKPPETGVSLLRMSNGVGRPAGNKGVPAQRLAFSRDGKRLAARAGSEVQFLDPASGAVTLTRGGLTGSATAGLRFARDGRLAICSGGGVRVWSVGAAGGELVLRGVGSDLDIDWMPDGRLVSLGDGGSLAVREVAEQEGRTFKRPGGGYGVVVPLPGGDGAITAARTLRRISLLTGEVEREYRRLLDLGTGASEAFAVSADGRTLASVRLRSNEVEVYDIGGAFLRLLPGDEGTTFVALSPDGRRLARLGPGRVSLWDFKSGECAVVELPGRRPARAAFTPDGDAVVIACSDKRSVALLALGVATREVRLVRDLPFAEAVSLEARPGRVFVGGPTASAVIDLMTGATVATVATGPVLHAAFSPDGQRLATAGSRPEDGVALWDVATGQQVGRLPADLLIRHSLAFTPDGRQLVASGRPGVGDGVRVWDCRPRAGQVIVNVGENAP